ncbi:MAG: excinuclease ABC subunit UvrC [Syntrophaceae bacterium]|nr:excinuclease ABC subunit UvrC [Syntrophaceae bacterium]
MAGELEAKISHAPRNPGVYLMKAQDGEILYVGKARDLMSRVRAYFSRTDNRAMIPFLVSKVRDIEFIITATEKEALILENNLIKEHRPRYNVLFRDDKSYFQIRIDPAEPFARFQLVRRPKRDGARYFGPYPSGGAARETLRFLQTIFPLRSCRDQELKGRRRPCLEHEIGRCSAPCVDRIDAEAYGRLVKEGIAFLEGRERTLIGDLKERMNRAAEGLRFEEAASLRDRIAAIEETLERQRIVSGTVRNRDVFGLFREGDFTQVSVLFIRGGRVIGQKLFPLIRLRAETKELLSSVLVRYYDGVGDIPPEICLPHTLADSEVLADWLSERRDGAVSLMVPKRGEARALLAIAGRNAESALRTARLTVDRPEEEGLALLAEKLRLRRLPSRMECCDISNIGGRYAAGSVVAFVNGQPHKAGYRHFRIRTVPGADDFAMMYEVLKRRYAGREELPDLVVVDGGKGQLGVALAVFKDLGIGELEVIALAKERDDDPSPAGPPLRGKGQGAGKGEDRVFLPGRKDPVYLSRWPAALFILQRLRDEAHRFAVSYYRKVKEKEDLRSILDGVPGIGAARRKALLTFFGDAGRIRSASVLELQQAEGIGAETARRIKFFFEKEGTKPSSG